MCPLTQGPKEIAQVRDARGLDAAQDPLAGRHGGENVTPVGGKYFELMESDFRMAGSRLHCEYEVSKWCWWLVAASRSIIGGLKPG